MTANTPQSRKAKGRGFQQNIRNRLIAELDLDPVDVQSIGMGQPGCDIYLSKEARKKFPYGVECKRQERLNIWETIEQAENNAKKEGLKPLVIFRRNLSEAYVIIRLNDFIEEVK